MPWYSKYHLSRCLDPKKQLQNFVWCPPWHLSICYWQIFWHSICHIFWQSIWHSIWQAYVPAYLVAFHLHSIWHIFWHIIWQIFWHSIWQTFWHFIWHIFWHSIWHFIWHSIWHTFWHSIWHMQINRSTANKAFTFEDNCSNTPLYPYPSVLVNPLDTRQDKCTLNRQPCPNHFVNKKSHLQIT